MIESLVPVSANIAEDMRTVLESHILERNKVQYRHPAQHRLVDPIFEGSVKPKNKFKGYTLQSHHGQAQANSAPGGAANTPSDAEQKTDHSYISYKNDPDGSYLQENKGAKNNVYREIGPEFASSGDTTVDNNRERIRKTLLKERLRSAFVPSVNAHILKRLHTIKAQIIGYFFLFGVLV